MKFLPEDSSVQRVCTEGMYREYVYLKIVVYRGYVQRVCLPEDSSVQRVCTEGMYRGYVYLKIVVYRGYVDI